MRILFIFALVIFSTSPFIFAKDSASPRTTKKQATRPQEKRLEGAQFLENKYKMKFCDNNEDIHYYFIDSLSSGFQKNCMYMLLPNLKVSQVVDGGVLLFAPGLTSYSSKSIFLSHVSKYVDDDIIGSLLVKYTGPVKYTTVLGAQRTVHSFKYLSDINLIRDDNDGYNVAPNQK